MVLIVFAKTGRFVPVFCVSEPSLLHPTPPSSPERRVFPHARDQTRLPTSRYGPPANSASIVNAIDEELLSQILMFGWAGLIHKEVTTGFPAVSGKHQHSAGTRTTRKSRLGGPLQELALKTDRFPFGDRPEGG